MRSSLPEGASTLKFSLADDTSCLVATGPSTWIPRVPDASNLPALTVTASGETERRGEGSPNEFCPCCAWMWKDSVEILRVFSPRWSCEPPEVAMTFCWDWSVRAASCRSERVCKWLLLFLCQTHYFVLAKDKLTSPDLRWCFVRTVVRQTLLSPLASVQSQWPSSFPSHSVGNSTKTGLIDWSID